MKVICFDLEGPLSPQDNAYDVMGLVKGGFETFEVLSKYDDILALEGRSGYEPGDTLKLIVPFLLLHGITESDIKRVSDKAKVVAGADEVVSALKQDGWNVNIISTSYMQHALNIGAKVGVDEKNIYCTQFPLDEFAGQLDESDLAMVRELEEIIPTLSGDEQIKKVLDKFYWKDIKGTALGSIMGNIRVVGGARKVLSVEKVLLKTGAKMSDIVVVGDSITDFRMLRTVKDARGLAIVFNGNKYALPYGNVGLASMSQKPLLKLTDAFSEGGLDKVRQVIEDYSENGVTLSWLADVENEDEVLAAHVGMRKAVRGDAGNLG